MFPRLRLREPFCGLSHLAGVALSVVGLVALLSVSHGKPWRVLAFSIYGGSLVFLYLASALYHSACVEPRRVDQLRMLDHVGIYLLIAGTWTPICLLALGDPWRWPFLGVVWAIALTGSVLRITWPRFPSWLNFGLYFVMGYLALVVIHPLSRALTPGGMAWLLLGGLLYSVGSVIMVLDRPRLWPGRFGSHDLWHVLCLGGSACHFVVIRSFVAAAG